ncbi:Retrovirus-related Pol polyprotein from transposon TNT 1-94 [Vitis vinifera]|uniref:Retrovirus-related Pol polyprotein from transposon TNT 1-94 n=1 Tax=Vitis vinifera TaxID=29760 RepID=A0A438K4F7_VITVI|nr:Retrovirus-related Pol polyprotein from transposon TNT 1-94 [Vitis vinifera]
MKAEEWALLDKQVLGVIRLTLSRSVAHNVVKEKTTTDLIKALSGMYEKSSANNKVHLMKKLFNLKMTENASVAQHLNEFNTITNQLSSVEIDFDDEIRALIVLASLLNSWETMRMAISNSTGKEKLKYNDIRDLILAEEIRRRDAGETSRFGSALNLETRDKGNDRNSNRGRSNSRNSNRNISKSRSGQQVQCWNCGKTGHFKRQCKSPKKKNEDDSANDVTEEVHDALLLAVDSPLDDWVLDSRALFHTTPHREIIQNYVAGDFGKVYLADGSALDVVGLGNVRISLPMGHAILLSMGTWKVIKRTRVLARGKKTGTLYMTSCPRDTIAVADASTDTSLWHSKLGHMRKQKNVSFLKTGKTPKAEKLELVYTDLWGPSLVASLGGSRGFSEYCDAQGIRMEKTIPRTPQQNGVAECMNRTLNERARSMRLHAGLPKTFWADAVSTAAYLINRGPSVTMEFRLPEEIWSANLMQSQKYVFFIGYGDEKFGYRSTVVSDVTEIDQKKSEFVNLYELTENENSSKWELAMKDEMDSLLGNQTWELTELPIGKKALHNKWDVKTTFLHGDLEEDLYMNQPEGFIVQSFDNSYIILLLYVDDMLITGSDIEKINNLKKQLSKQFAMKDLGVSKQILGMRIIRDKANGTLKLSQSEYVKKVLSRFNMNEAKPVSTPLGSHLKLSKE